MEEIVTKAVNLGIGAVLSVSSEVEKVISNLQEELNALASKGETVEGSQVAKVRETADKAVALLTELQAKAEETLTSVKTQVQPLIDQAKTAIENLRGNKTQAA